MINFAYLSVVLKLLMVTSSPGMASKNPRVSAQSFSTYSVALFAKKRNLKLVDQRNYKFLYV